MRTKNLVSTVVRYHKHGNLDYLFEALHSISAQSHDDIEIILCLQDVSEETTRKISEFAKKTFEKTPKKRVLKTKTFTSTPAKKDLRSTLFTAGIEQASGEYITFLDFDDIIYPYAYQMLIDFFDGDDCALVAGGIDKNTYLDVEGVEKLISSTPFNHREYQKYELYHHNFLPLHCYMIRAKFLESLPIQETLSELSMFEDYALLLLLASKFRFQLENHSCAVGEYRFRIHEPNSTLRIQTDPDTRKLWLDSYKTVESLKDKMLIALSAKEIKDIITRERLNHFKDLSYSFLPDVI